MIITTAIASTTRLDRHNECLSKTALEDMAKQINSIYIPQTIEHDINHQVGVVLYAEVFQLKDGAHALGIVIGLFETKEEKKIFQLYQPNTTWDSYKLSLNISELINLVDNNRTNLGTNVDDSSDVEDLLAIHLDSTKVLPDGTVYKVKHLITQINDLRIVIYPKDHTPAHFHVISKQKGIDIRFHLYTLQPISIKAGRIIQADIKKVQNFFRTYPEQLRRLQNRYISMQ